MRRHGDTIIANRILLALPPIAWDKLKPHLEPFDLKQGRSIFVTGAPVEHLYFVNRGLVSLVKSMTDGRSVEIGAVGIEGIAGLEALYGIESAILDSIVQIDGQAFRIERRPLQLELNRGKAIRELLQRSYLRGLESV